MLRKFKNEVFNGFRDRDSGALFEDVQFEDCRFEDCFVSMTNDPQLRSTIRDVRLVNCEVLADCTLGCAIVEDSIVDGLKCIGDRLRLQGPVYRHVVLRGDIDSLMLTGSFAWEPEVRAAFNLSDRDYYADVDWALDIADARFRSVTIRGVPTELIRRDPATQAVVRREALQDRKWEALPLQCNLFDTTMRMLLESDDADRLLIAPRSHPEFSALLCDLQTLRSEGIVAPD